MINNYLNIYNNLVNLTRNKNLYQNLGQNDTFSDRLTILLFHFCFFLKRFKSENSKDEMQKIHDFLMPFWRFKKPNKLDRSAPRGSKSAPGTSPMYAFL